MSLLIPPALVADIPLSSNPESWREHVIDRWGLPQSQTASFSLSDAGLRVGPWLAGAQAARFEYTVPITVLKGMIRGRYRTDRMLPRQAAVWLEFLEGSRVLATCDYPLAASENWRELNLPIYRAPPGTTGVRVAFGLREKTAGMIHFADLRISEHYEPLQFDAIPPVLTRPAPPPPLAPAPRVRLVQTGGTWWLVSPAGKPFFSAGSALSESDTVGVRPSERIFAAMQRAGFNSVGGDHEVRLWSQFNAAQAAAGKPVVYQFRIAESLPPGDYDLLTDAHGGNPGPRQAEAVRTGGFNHAFPDPFDPKWQETFRLSFRQLAEVSKGQGYLAAWFAGNERHHRDLPRFVWSPHCAVKLGEFLAAKYATISALNAKWGTTFSSFDDLLRQKPDPVVRAGPMFADFQGFSREIVRKYNEVMLRVIREEDPGVLVFSNRFMMGETEDTFEVLDLYRDFDAIAVNLYPSSTEAGLDASERQYLSEVHRRTGKPVLISEWSVPALDSGLYNNPEKLDWSYPQTVETEHDRALEAAAAEAYFYNQPFVIGAHWFTWEDIDSARRRANRGLFKANGEPWSELLSAMAQVNLRFPQL